MDYAFGEQAYESMEELLKPYTFNDEKIYLNVSSISIMGKAGILEGGKGDIMIPSAHLFEGTADNYPFDNELCIVDWEEDSLEMEGAHYQKAIQAASKLRGNIQKDIKVRYAYYASDNPLETGSTLASGGLGTTGVKPTYLITEKILNQIYNS